MERSALTSYIREKASEMGFVSCGFAAAARLDKEALRLSEWLERGMQAEMHYMQNHFDLRTDPRELMPGAKSVVVLAFNYYPGEEAFTNSEFKISRYAQGSDYHEVLRDKLGKLLSVIQTVKEDVQGRICVDSAPIMEKAWAQRSGIGWQGKNSLLLTKDHGSYVFLGIILLNIELDYDQPETDHCGNCHKCLVACPTHAIVSPGVIDSNSCISYHTIERKGVFTEETPRWKDWIFGCDICQEVCPYNNKPILTGEAEFLPRISLLNLKSEDWIKIDVEQYQEIFRKSPVKRAKFDGLKRNMQWVSSKIL